MEHSKYVKFTRTLNRYMCVIPSPILVPWGWKNQQAGQQLAEDLRAAYKKYMNSCGLEGDPEDHQGLLADKLSEVWKTQVFLLSAIHDWPIPPIPPQPEEQNQKEPTA